MPFQLALNKFNPKKLILIDGFGALLSAFLLGVVLTQFESTFGMPKEALYFLSVFPSIFAVYDFSCYLKVKANWSPFLKIIAIANLIYCCISIAFVFQHFQQLTSLGLIYFLLEFTIIIILVHVELKTASNLMNEDFDPLPYFKIQEQLAKKIEPTNQLPSSISYIAGVDVAYDDEANRMVGAIVVLNAATLEAEDQAYHEMEITFPYIPGLFSFREIPPILEAYQKLKIKPELIVCDGHGIAHPKKIGLASHLGIELGIPTIGCAKKRLVGTYDTVGDLKGNFASLWQDQKEVGRVLRTQDNIKPMFVSIGHKVSIEVACEIVLNLCPKYRLPETTRKADALVNKILKNPDF